MQNIQGRRVVSTLQTSKTESFAYLSVLGVKKCSFFGKFGVLFFLETPGLRFDLLPDYRRVNGLLKVLHLRCLLGSRIRVQRGVFLGLSNTYPVDTGRKLNVHKAFRRCHVRSIYVLCLLGIMELLAKISVGYRLRYFSKIQIQSCHRVCMC